MKRYRNKLILAVSVFIVLLITFWWGGNSPGLHGWNIDNKSTISSSNKAYNHNISEGSADTKKISEGEPNNTLNDALYDSKESDIQVLDSSDEEEASNSENIISENQLSAKTEDGEQAKEIEEQTENYLINEEGTYSEDKENICTISVKCSSILDNMEYLDKSKADLIPPDGIILAETKAVFNEGENVFNVLQRELKRAKIHFEFTNTPMFDSVYIEGINNIYEFDCGENSGWMYSVNGQFPNYGCSKYILKAGDVIEWVYTCDLGRDVGGYYANAE